MNTIPEELAALGMGALADTMGIELTEATADKVVVLDKGRIALAGRPAEVFGRVAELKALGLDAPLAAEIADRLRAAGFAVPGGVITDEELAVALWP